MRLRYLYQTLDDRFNADEIEIKGPFKCINTSAWLGEGYYFWDSSIEAARWWGLINYKNSFVICRSQYDYDSLEYLDLVGNTDHLKIIKECAEFLKQKIRKDITVSMIIEHMKRYSNLEHMYKAIRAYPINSRKNGQDTISFIDKNTAYMNLDPPIQVCILDKSFLYKNKFEIIYPEIYCNDYLV